MRQLVERVAEVVDVAPRFDQVMSSSRTGACVCGGISYVAHNVAPIWYCHCEQCRRMTGHFMAAAQVNLDDIEIKGEPKWFFVNERSRHGFCPDCGSQLFWRNEQNPYMSITGGSMNDSSNLSNKGHIFVAEKGGYYDLPDNEVQCARWTPAEE